MFRIQKGLKKYLYETITKHHQTKTVKYQWNFMVDGLARIITW